MFHILEVVIIYEMRKLWLDRDNSTYEKWLTLIEKANLSEGDWMDYTVGLFDGEELIATGSYYKNIIKYLVVCGPYQSENLLTSILTHLLEQIRSEGYTQFFVYTKPQNKMIFESLGFKTIMKSDELYFMELGSPGFSDYLSFLEKYRLPEVASAIVMNANPFTKGHLYLVETAAKSSSHVFVFVLSEDRSEFSATDREEMVKLGLQHLDNVTILPTRDYMVSSAVFPSYFLKEKAQMSLAKTQATLDASLFKEAIAPTLNIRTRFVGEEPFSEVTNIYNQAMQSVFGEELALKVIPRLEIGDMVVSATRVREALSKGDDALLKRLLPETSYRYIKNNKL